MPGRPDREQKQAGPVAYRARVDEVEGGSEEEVPRQLDVVAETGAQADAALLAYQSDAGDFADVMRSSIGYLNTRIEHIRLSVDRAQSYAMLANLGGLTP